MAATLTPTQRLASILIGEPIHDWITTRRANGTTWRQMAADLKDATDGELDLTSEVLRQWHEEVAA